MIMMTCALRRSERPSPGSLRSSHCISRQVPDGGGNTLGCRFACRIADGCTNRRFDHSVGSLNPKERNMWDVATAKTRRAGRAFMSPPEFTGLVAGWVGGLILLLFICALARYVS